tara:strand:- start:419 stop:610 length:192 start_codon:yes stop_codon:yes gene_type:complete
MKRSFFILSKTISNHFKPKHLGNVKKKEYITNPWSGKPINKKTNINNNKVQNILPEVINNYFK